MTIQEATTAFTNSILNMGVVIPKDKHDRFIEILTQYVCDIRKNCAEEICNEIQRYVRC